MNIEISPDNKTPIYGEMVTFTVKMTNEYGMPATGNMDFRVLGNFVDIDNSLGMG